MMNEVTTSLMYVISYLILRYEVTYISNHLVFGRVMAMKGGGGHFDIHNSVLTI